MSTLTDFQANAALHLARVHHHLWATLHDVSDEQIVAWLVAGDYAALSAACLAQGQGMPGGIDVHVTDRGRCLVSSPRQRPHFTSERQHDAYDEGWAAGRESIAASLADAFRAGAEYVRGVSFAMGWTNHPTTPPIVVAPTNEGITAAA